MSTKMGPKYIIRRRDGKFLTRGGWTNVLCESSWSNNPTKAKFYDEVRAIKGLHTGALKYLSNHKLYLKKESDIFHKMDWEIHKINVAHTFYSKLFEIYPETINNILCIVDNK